jgi:hypothetical protein
MTAASFVGASLLGATDVSESLNTATTLGNTICPDGTNSDSNDGGKCVGHLTPAP